MKYLNNVLDAKTLNDLIKEQLQPSSIHVSTNFAVEILDNTYKKANIAQVIHNHCSHLSFPRQVFIPGKAPNTTVHFLTIYLRLYILNLLITRIVLSEIRLGYCAAKASAQFESQQLYISSRQKLWSHQLMTPTKFLFFPLVFIDLYTYQFRLRLKAVKCLFKYHDNTNMVAGGVLSPSR